MTARPTSLLILGGTGEARDLADGAVARFGDGLAVTTALAGRTKAPARLAGAVRVGGFGGANGLARYLRDEAVDLLIDATHPFARTMPHNAARAAEAAGVPRLRLERAPWHPEPGDRWITVETTTDAAARTPALGRRVLLTVGGQEAAVFADAASGRATTLLCRAIEAEGLPPETPVFRHLLRRGPFDLAAERALLTEHGIDLLVTKNSGGAATAAKLTAAREAGLPVLMIDRPRPAAPGPRVERVDAALDWLAKRLEARR